MAPKFPGLMALAITLMSEADSFAASVPQTVTMLPLTMTGLRGTGAPTVPQASFVPRTFNLNVLTMTGLRGAASGAANVAPFAPVSLTANGLTMTGMRLNAPFSNLRVLPRILTLPNQR